MSQLKAESHTIVPFRKERHFFMIVSFIGNSMILNDDISEMKQKILRILEERVGDKECRFYLGGYGWFDEFAKACCREYAKTHNKCKLILVIPYINRKYYTEGYDDTLYPPLERVPYRLAIYSRNRYMIDKADFVVFYVSYIRKARNFLEYAQKRKKPLINISNSGIN